MLLLAEAVDCGPDDALPGDDEACGKSDLEVAVNGPWAAGLQGVASVSAGLLAGGLMRRGRWRAWHDARRGAAAPRRLARRRAVGWGLLGSGLALWAVTPALVGAYYVRNNRLGAFAFSVTQITVSYAGTALVATGLGLAPFAAGYLAQRGQDPNLTLGLAPHGTHGASVTLSGRF